MTTDSHQLIGIIKHYPQGNVPIASSNHIFHPLKRLDLFWKIFDSLEISTIEGLNALNHARRRELSVAQLITYKLQGYS